MGAQIYESLLRGRGLAVYGPRYGGVTIKNNIIGGPMKTKNNTGSQQASLRAGIIAASIMVFACFGAAIAFAGEARDAQTPDHLAGR